MQVLVAKHDSSLSHDTGSNHPERPGRVTAVLNGIRGSGLEAIEIESPSIERSELALVHEPTYIEMVEAYCAVGGGALDMDTYVSTESWEAALTAAGGVKELIDRLEDSNGVTGFAVTRPPGHHALKDKAMGFCLFNNVAVAAALLRARGERVAILDWDVHHGNGTQAMLGDDPQVLYVSLHQADFYPFEGMVEDIDRGAAKGTTVNIPLPAGTAGDVYREAWSSIVMPVLTQFDASWVLVSAGYDAHRNDPLADLRLTESDYGWIAARLSSVASPNRTVFALEGGYDLDALEHSAAATVIGMAGIDPGSGPEESSPTSAHEAVEVARRAVARHWSV